MCKHTVHKVTTFPPLLQNPTRHHALPSMTPVCASSPSVLASKSPPCSPVIGDTIAEKKPKKPLHVML